MLISSFAKLLLVSSNTCQLHRIRMLSLCMQVEELKQKMEKKTEATAQPGMVDPGMGMNSLVPVGMNMPGMGMPGMGGPMGGMQGGMPGMGGPMGYAPQPTGW